MKYWTRLYFYQNYTLRSSVSSVYHNYLRKVDTFPKKLYYNTSATLRTRKSMVNYYKSHLELKDLPIPDILSSLNSRIVGISETSSISEILTDSEIHSRLIQCTLCLSQFTNDQFLQFMDSLLILKSKDANAFHKHQIIKNVIKQVDNECYTRSYKVDLQDSLPILEKFSCLAKKGHGYGTLKTLVYQHNQKLHKQPVDIFFRFADIVNKHRYWGYASGNPYEIEYYLEHNFNNLNITQITTLIHVLIQRNQSIISIELKKKLFSYVIDNFCKMSHFHLFSFLNLFCIKESFCINMVGLTSEFVCLLNTFEEKFDTFPLAIVALVGFLSTKFLVHRPQYLEKLYQRLLVENVLSQKRTVDYIVYTLFFFNYRSNDKDAYSKILQVITSDPLKSSYKHTHRYIRLISWFCNMGFYFDDLIDEILNEEYLRKTYGKSGKTNRFVMYPYPLVIDFSVDIEYSDYKGHRLGSTMRNELLKCYEWDLINYHSLMDCHTDPYQLTDDTEQYNCKDTSDLPYCDILREIGSKLNTLYDAEITYMGYILPHMPRPNLLFCLNENKIPENLNYLKGIASFVDWKKLNSKYKWFAITVLIRNTLLPDTEAVSYGIEVTKIRHLQKLNFNVIGIVQDEWENMNDEQKTLFCTNLIQ